MRRGPLEAGEKVQFTDRRSNKITDQLVPGGVTQTSHGIILHDEVIGRSAPNVRRRSIRTIPNATPTSHGRVRVPSAAGNSP